MATLTVASKANHALLLPAILAATFATFASLDNATSPATTTVVYKDVEVVGSTKEYLKLELQDGPVVYDHAVLDCLREKFDVLQTGNKDLVSV